MKQEQNVVQQVSMKRKSLVPIEGRSSAVGF